jgi:hypothetical protein
VNINMLPSLANLVDNNDNKTGVLGGGITKPTRRQKTPLQVARDEAAMRPPLNPSEFGLGRNQSGVTVIPFASQAKLPQLRAELAAYVDAMPEYRRSGFLPFPYRTGEEIFETDPTTFAKGGNLSPSTFDNDSFFPVEGGFAALGNPSSFHNPFVRKLRMAAHVAVLESGVVPIAADEKFEQVADRLMVRRSTKNPTAESWHRDESKFAVPGDTVYGGWVNLDLDRTQFFSMVPYSANEVTGQNNGFSTIPESQHVSLIKRSVRVAVPPGHILIFNERTIHEVVAKPLSEADKSGKTGAELARCRLFFGWRTTKAQEPITPNLTARLEVQEALPIKSGQNIHPRPPPGAPVGYPGPPAMYSKLHTTNFPMLVKRLASHLKPAATTIYKYAAGGKQAARFPNGLIAPILYMPSLKEMNAIDPTITMYGPYTKEEVSILYPSRTWTNLQRLDGSVVETLTL